MVIWKQDRKSNGQSNSCPVQLKNRKEVDHLKARNVRFSDCDCNWAKYVQHSLDWFFNKNKVERIFTLH
jgi:hypothetical protein